MPDTSECQDEFLELMANMAGNAFSIWHYGPSLCALLATMGKFSRQGEVTPAASAGGGCSVQSSPRTDGGDSDVASSPSP
eukprot:8247632-Lingulodinium_polyedra.AAC.1